ncbi:MAG TPA: hypothetical protein VHB54_20695 [Mucilaginibacter sp.]|nr:hypothetical protein [Mucilaginibacter sp.]
MKTRLIVYLALACIVSSISAEAQNADSLTQRKQFLDSTLRAEHLQVIEGNPRVFYSNGFQPRSNAIQKLVHDCIIFYESEFAGKRFDQDVFILDRNDWERLKLEFPYGLPFYSRNDRMLVVPAEKNALRRLSGMPDDPEKSEAVISTFDYQVLHELGHYFFFTLNNVYTEKWMNEFLATYFLLCYIQPRDLAPDLPKMLQANFPVSHRTLDDFENIYTGVGPANYHWYQSKFAMLGYSLYPQLKEKLIVLALQNYSPGGKHLDAKNFLLSLSPGTVSAWLNEMK